jgi:hypothetical protein
MATPVPPSLLDTVVEGHTIEPVRLGALLDQRTTVLVFLRHYG